MGHAVYADDLILADISLADLQERFGEWQEALESKGLKENADKTDYSMCKDSKVSADYG